MEQMYDFQFPSTNTSSKSAGTVGPSKRVVENILKAAQNECSVLNSFASNRQCFQHIRFDSVRMEICLN